MGSAKRVLFGVSVALLVLSGCSTGGDDTKTIKVAHYAGRTHPLSVSLEEIFKPMVEKNSNGTLKVEIYGDSKLGSETEYLSVLRSGSIQMAVNGAMMSSEVPQVSVIGLPFLFENLEEAKRVLASPVARETTPDFEDKLGLHVLGFGGSGFRVFTSNSPLHTLGDFQGLKLRVSEGYEIATKTGQALGANVTPLPFSELFTAIESGVITAQENPLATIIAGKIYEVQDYALLTRHILAHDILCMNNEFWNSLSAEEQAVVQEAVDASLENIWGLLMEAEQKNVRFLQEQGLEVSEPSEALRAELLASVQPVYDWFYAQNAWAKELVDKINAAK